MRVYFSQEYEVTLTNPFNEWNYNRFITSMIFKQKVFIKKHGRFGKMFTTVNHFNVKLLSSLT